MANSPKNLVGKAVVATGKVVLTGIICAGLVWSASAYAGNTTYQYDSLGRVIKVTYPDSKQICYTYDSAGNRTQVKRQGTGTCTVTGSTLSSSMTAQTMLMARQTSELQATSDTTSTTDSQMDATTPSSTTEETATTN